LVKLKSFSRNVWQNNFSLLSHGQDGEILIMPLFFFLSFLLFSCFLFFPSYIFLLSILSFTISPHLLHLIHSPRLHQPPPPRLPAPAASSPPTGSPSVQRPPSPRGHAPQHPSHSGRPAFSVSLVSSAAGGRNATVAARRRPPAPPISTSPEVVAQHLHHLDDAMVVRAGASPSSRAFFARLGANQ
jgi:hypothetical protein